MLSGAIVILIIIVVLTLILSFIFTAWGNVNVIKKILRAKIKRSFWAFGFKTLIRGEYKGKEIVVDIVNFSPQSTWCYIYSPIGEPSRVWSLLDLPNITKNTYYLKGKGIAYFNYDNRDLILKHFTKGPTLSSNNHIVYRTLREEDFVKIFDELVKAVDIFNANPAKYTKN